MFLSKKLKPKCLIKKPFKSTKNDNPKYSLKYNPKPQKAAPKNVMMIGYYPPLYHPKRTLTVDAGAWARFGN